MALVLTGDVWVMLCLRTAVLTPSPTPSVGILLTLKWEVSLVLV